MASMASRMATALSLAAACPSGVRGPWPTKTAKKEASRPPAFMRGRSWQPLPGSPVLWYRPMSQPFSSSLNGVSQWVSTVSAWACQSSAFSTLAPAPPDKHATGDERQGGGKNGG